MPAGHDATDEGRLYLATTLDLYSRRVVAWAMNERMTSQLVIDALTTAIEQRRHRRSRQLPVVTTCPHHR